MKRRQGFSLIELLIAISFVSVLTVVIVQTGLQTRGLRRLTAERLEALLYAQEAMEVFSQTDWKDLPAGQYHPQLATSSWQVATGTEVLNNRYTRLVELSDVYRASSTRDQIYGPIVTSGGYLDPNSKKISARISWQTLSGATSTEVMDSYLVNWRASRLQQTDWSGGPGQTDWTDPTKFFSSAEGIEYSIPGILSLKIGNIDWSYASTTSFFNTPGNFDDNDVVARDGVAYLVTENNPSDAELYIIDISDINNLTEMSRLDLNESLTAVAKQGDYLYISSADNAEELKVVDVTDPYTPTQIFSYNLPSNTDTSDIAITATELYISQGTSVHSFSLANPINPAYLDTYTINDQIHGLFVAGNVLYMATQDASNEVQFVNITAPASLELFGTFDIVGSVKANDVYAVGSRAYVSTDNNGGAAEYNVIDISNPSSPQLLGAYEVNETVFSSVVIGDFALIGSNFLDEELIVLDVANPAAIQPVSGFDLFGKILGMTTNCSTIYAATSGNQGEFFVISTGLLDCDIASSGFLESSTFDTGSDTVEYNWLSWRETGTAETDVTLQLATSDSPSGPWNYIGPDGSSSTYYINAVKEFIPYFVHKDQRYFRYRAYLSTEAAYDVPIVEDITVSYSL